MSNAENHLLKVLLAFSFLALLPGVSFAAETNSPVLSKHGVVAYTWNSNASAEHANLGKSRYTFNNGQPVSRERLAQGVYQVKFETLNCERGQFTVNAYGGADYKSCRIGSWRGANTCEVSVYCFDAQGKHFDSQFNLVFID